MAQSVKCVVHVVIFLIFCTSNTGTSYQVTVLLYGDLDTILILLSQLLKYWKTSCSLQVHSV